MAIDQIIAGQGLLGGGASHHVQLSVDGTVVPLLQDNNTFAGSQTVEGDVKVGGTLSTAQLAVANSDQVYNLNASYVGGVPEGELAKLDKHNEFGVGQQVDGTVTATGNSYELNPFPGFGTSAPGLVGFGCIDFTSEVPDSFPEAGSGVIGWGGDQFSRGIATGGTGVHGIGGDQTGLGGGGDGVSGIGGDGTLGQWGGNGGNFHGGYAQGGDGGPGVRTRGADANPTGPFDPDPDDFHFAGDGIQAAGGYSYSYNASPGMGGMFFGGTSQYNVGYDGLWGIPGYGPTNKDDGRAGVFEGNVLITGSLHVSGHKSFRIDHPVRPAEEMLEHACVESSELLTIYSGNVVLGPNGQGTVHLPDWFESLNTDFRYQLTPVGVAAPVFISEEICQGRFSIGGGHPGMKVSWQITAVRHDPQAKLDPLQVEVRKEKKTQGFYVHPHAYGLDERKGLHWATHPAVMKRIAQHRMKATTKSAQGVRVKPQLTKPHKSV